MQNLRKCLVVDDASVVRKVARVILEDMAFHVDEAESARDALEYCRAEMPTLIILDWHMPGAVSATDFLTGLRSLGGNKRAVVLYMTTEVDLADISRAFQAGADDYILKPFNRVTIERKLEEIGPALSFAAA